MSARERLLIVRSMFWVSLYRLGLWVLPFRWARQWLRADIPAVTMVVNRDESVVKDTIRSVRLCSRYVPYATCLTQALAARTLLNRYGQPAVLKIGVAKNEGSLEAHAWLEIDGRVVLGKQPLHSRYAVLGTPPSVLV